MSEDEAFDALESLRGKQLVVRVDVANSRVHRYKQAIGETLRARTARSRSWRNCCCAGRRRLGSCAGAPACTRWIRSTW
jgi:hypothetical protein